PGYLIRTYTNLRTYESVKILIICGASGPTSVHTPDVCYRGAGFVMKSDAVRHAEEIKGVPAPVEMWTAEFHKPQGLLAQELRIYWGGSADGVWSAPSYPRWHSAGRKALFKLYVIRSTSEGTGAERDEVCMNFLADFLPKLNKELFPADAPGGSTAV